MVVGEMDAFVDSQSVREDVLLLGQLGIVLRETVMRPRRILV